MYISIVIPTRNRPELLGKALRAIQLQSFKEFEVIVVDDGSDEKAAAAYKELWSDLDNRFILHSLSRFGSKGIGPSAARNVGISLAHGDILAFCDDDDFWISPEHLEKVASVFAENSNVDIYIANQIGVFSQKTEICDWFPALTAKFKSGSGGNVTCGAVSVQDLCSAGGFAHLNILCLRKKIVEQVGGFWERISYEEDRDFFWRAVDCSDTVFFNSKIIGQHNIPDSKKTENQSTQHSIVERWLLSTLVCQHIATTVKNPLISRLARRYEGDILRRLTLHFSRAGQPSLGFAFARRALSARFSLKWSGYMAVLGIKTLLTGKAS